MLANPVLLQKKNITNMNVDSSGGDRREKI